MPHAMFPTHVCERGVTTTNNHNDQSTEPEIDQERELLKVYRELDEADRVVVESALLTEGSGGACLRMSHPHGRGRCQTVLI